MPGTLLVLEIHTGVNKTDLGPILMGLWPYGAQRLGVTGTHSRHSQSSLKVREGQAEVRQAEKGKMLQAGERVWVKARGTRWPELRPGGEVRLDHTGPFRPCSAAAMLRKQ